MWCERRKPAAMVDDTRRLRHGAPTSSAPANAGKAGCRMTTLDALLTQLGHGLRSLAGGASAGRATPGDGEAALDARERHQSAALMRVNHCGEVCAQALYRGQAVTARQPDVRETLANAAAEEEEHLAWCRQRLDELGGRTSWLDPAFYVASFALGAAAGLMGDRLSLGFVAATEAEVRHHLDRHLARLPAADGRSRAILAAMREDEIRHGERAVDAGGTPYPAVVRTAMRLASTVMTKTTYHV